MNLELFARARRRTVIAAGLRGRAVIAAGLRGRAGTGFDDAPSDGETYGRQNASWVSLASTVAGVASFNGRVGTVQLTGADVTTALGYTPANSASLATVATSGSYVDLADKPFIPTAPGDLGAASTAQGALADTAVQPAVLTAGLSLKVDKVTGYGLSQEDFTTAEKAKLAGLEGSHFKGLFASLVALETAFPTASAGDYADVDAGVGSDTIRYVWDVSDTEWQPSGSGAPLTAADIKTLYESNPDTNAYTDAEKSKLSGVAANATANPDTDSLAEGAANKWFTEARVRSALATGLSFADSTIIAATDSFLQIAGKLAARLALAFDRTNHTGTQAQSTVTNLTTDLAAKITNPMTTAADLIVGGASGVPARLAKGTALQVLRVNAGATALEYADPSAGALLPVVQTLSSSRSLTLADANTFNVNSTATAYTATIPAQASVAWAPDTEIHFLRSSTGAITITAAAGVSINGVTAASVTLGVQHGAVTLKRISADVWWVGGLIGDDGSGWISPTLVNGWIVQGGAFQDPQYKKIGNLVYIRGLTRNPSSVAGTIFTLPAGFRPPATVSKGTFYGNLSATFLNVTSAGVVSVGVGAAEAALPLDFIFEVTP